MKLLEKVENGIKSFMHKVFEMHAYKAFILAFMKAYGGKIARTSKLSELKDL